jgi:beta-carotene 15,15'-dioxygenase
MFLRFFIVLRRLVVQTPTLLTIIAGVILAGYQHFVGPLPLLFQLIFCGFLLLVAGIPHGALDHLVEQERANRLGKQFLLGQFLAKYLLTMGVYAGAWLLAPVPCLLVFLLISAWHFGETDLANAPETPYWSLARLSAGGFVLAFILLTHADETTPILFRIVQADELAVSFWQGLVLRSGAILRGWGTLVVVLTMLAYGQRASAIDGWRLARLLIIIGLTYFLPLLPAFMLYFGGWHALSSFHSLRHYLPVNAPTPTQAALHVWKQSLPLTGVAFGFLAVFLIVLTELAPSFDYLPILFIFLSLITLPHINVMHAVNS